MDDDSSSPVQGNDGAALGVSLRRGTFGSPVGTYTLDMRVYVAWTIRNAIDSPGSSMLANSATQVHR